MADQRTHTGPKLKYAVILFLTVVIIVAVYLLMQLEKEIRGSRIITVNIGEQGRILPDITTAELSRLAAASKIKFRTGDEYFSILENKIEYGEQKEEWNEHFLKGVNLGAALPGKFPSEFPEDYNVYMEWFRKIAEMNSNVVRIYTIFPPVFYQAFAQYNFYNFNKPLYLIHGVWAVETENNDYYHGDYTDRFEREIKDVIDVIHGKAIINQKSGHAHGVYPIDISAYTIAILLGREWEPLTVTVTNQKNQNIKSYNGNFISLPYGSPMESWLAKVMDFTIQYETQIYQAQRPVSFVNWIPLDPMYHNTEYIENEKVKEDDNDLEVVDYRRFYSTNLFKGGIFAAYHAYPYYPDFLYLDDKYKEGINKHGQRDNYINYLNTLKNYNPDIPLLIAEYGVPSSAGNSHYSPFGFHQGGHTEKEQAEINKILTEDIYDTKCAGAVYFAWMDEWFKHNWLVMDFEQPYENRHLWHNVRNPEENYGLLAVENKVKTIDGNSDDWNDQEEIFSSDNFRMSASADASYLYLKINYDKLDLKNNNLFIAIDTYDKNKGDTKIPFLNVELNRGIEYVLQIYDKDSANIIIDEPYTQYNDIFTDYMPVFASSKNNNGLFIRQQVISNRQREGLLGDRYENIVIDRSSLQHGNSSHPETSNAAWFFNENDMTIELRIDWHLLNVSDPSSMNVVDDKPGTRAIESSVTDGLNFYPFITDENNKIISEPTGRSPINYKWNTWTTPDFTTRFKRSYEMFRELFPALKIPENKETSANGDSLSLRITDWYRNKNGAISVIFKGGSFSQYETALPVLDKYGLKATYSINTALTEENPSVTTGEGRFPIQRLGWQQVTELSNKGFEIAEYIVNAQAGDLSQGLIESEKRTNHKLLTFIYDNSLERNINELFSKGLLFGVSIGAKNQNTDLRIIKGMEIINSAIPEPQDMYKYITSGGNWSVIIFNNVFAENSKEMEMLKGTNYSGVPMISSGHFERLIRIIRNTDYWVAPVSSVGRYITEKNNSSLSVVNQGNIKFISINSNLDRYIYNQPLTVEISTNWQYVKVTNSVEDGIYNPRNGRIYINIQPGKEVILEKL